LGYIFDTDVDAIVFRIFSQFLRIRGLGHFSLLQYAGENALLVSWMNSPHIYRVFHF